MGYRNAVKESFGRAAPEYEAQADFQQEVAEELLEFVRSAAPADEKGKQVKILDTGCGTGRLMRELMHGRGCEDALYGLDIALPMLAEAAGTLSGIGADSGWRGVSKGEDGGERPEVRKNLINGACEALPLGSGLFGLVVSNLAYQWVSDLQTAFTEVERVLQPGGTFVFSTLGPATLHELLSSLTGAQSAAGGKRFAFTPFAAVKEVEEALKSAGLQPFDTKVKKLIRRYDTPLHLLKRLKRTGASPRGRVLESGLSMGTFLRSAIRIYKERFSYVGGGISATYEVLFISARKKL